MRKLPSPSKFLSPFGFNNAFLRLPLESDTGGRECRTKKNPKLEARVEFNEIYFRHEFPAIRCTRWHIAIVNQGPETLIVTGWEVVTFTNVIQRVLGVPTKLQSDFHDFLRSLPQPDYPGRAIPPGTSIQIFVAAEPENDLLRQCWSYLRVSYEGRTQLVRLRYLPQ